jgi:tetratricopeptide (TPR) repeat protein
MSLAVDKVLRKAQSHIKAGELTEAEELYKQVLSKFPKNKKAIQGYQKLKLGMISKGLSTSEPPQEQVENLLTLYNKGQFEELLAKVKPLISLFPKTIELYNLQGASNALIERNGAAIESYDQAIKINPKYADAHLNKGSVLQKNGEFDAAMESFNKALSINPYHSIAHFNMGNALNEKSELDASVESYEKAIKIKPDYAEAYFNMGIVLENKGELDAAMESYEQAIKIKPDYAEAYNNMGNARKDTGDLDTAIDNYKQVLKIKPDYEAACNNIGIILTDKGEFDAAIDSYKQAIKIKPDYAEAFNNMGNALENKGELDAAMESYKQAIKIKPDYAEAYSNMGNALKDKAELDAAIDSYKQAIKIEPEYAEAHQSLGLAFLNAGRLKEGLDEYEWRWKTAKRLSKKRHFSQPLWDGEKSLKGKKVLVWCEQGVGDTINWSSCLPLVASQAEYCVLECQEKLVPLLARSFPNVEVKPENRSLDSERDDFDFHVPTGSLYRHFITEITQNPRPDAFLVPDPVRVKFWRERLNSLGNGPYVGISWKSSNMSPERLPNYASISDWSPILTIPSVTFINLQYKDFADDLAKIQNELGVTVHNFDDLDHYDNLLDVAALSAALDVVVSNKTTVPLITAGVGTSTKLANWKQSPWNNILLNPVGPSVDIFERNTWEPWDNVFRLIAEDIFKLAENWSSRCTKSQ